MAEYTPPLADYRFLRDAMVTGDLASFYDGLDADADTMMSIVEEAGKIARDILHPLNSVGDQQGCTRHADGTVTTPEGFRDAYLQFCEAGWNALSSPAECGGHGQPALIAAPAEEFFNSANQSFTMYTGWGFYASLLLSGEVSAALRRDYLPKVVSGEWNGTMALTEAHCGTDIGLLRTKASRNDDGTYAISGTKIFNSGGEHDLSDNIVHFVLARLDDAPQGTRGISLFMVPKRIVEEDGSLSDNAVSCLNVEHKMGLRASATCTMQFDDAKGWLLGEENLGLAQMFALMNHTRRSTGTIAIGLAEAAMQQASAYVRERLQGKALGERDRAAPADPLVRQPDVRRQLMHMRAIVEGGRALNLWTAIQTDILENGSDPQSRREARQFLDLITPVCKAYLSDRAFECTVMAQQLHGGHGYIVETGIEQLVRDCRVLMVGEGANAIQANDVMLRSIRAGDGANISLFIDKVKEALAQSNGEDQLAPALGLACDQLSDVVDRLAIAPIEEALLHAYAVMAMIGHVALGLMWLTMAGHARHEIAAGCDGTALAKQKLATARFFAEQILPECGALAARTRAGADYLMEEDALGC